MHISNISKPNASSINFYLLKTWWAQESTILSIFTKIYSNSKKEIGKFLPAVEIEIVNRRPIKIISRNMVIFTNKSLDKSAKFTYAKVKLLSRNYD